MVGTVSIVALFRIEPEDDGRRLFRKMLAKSFTCTALRSQFNELLEVEDVMRLLGYSMEVLALDYRRGQFDKVGRSDSLISIPSRPSFLGYRVVCVSHGFLLREDRLAGGSRGGA